MEKFRTDGVGRRGEKEGRRSECVREVMMACGSLRASTAFQVHDIQ